MKLKYVKILTLLFITVTLFVSACLLTACNDTEIKTEPDNNHNNAESDCNHKVEIDVGYSETCITDGLTYGCHCDKCGAILVEQEVIPAHHDIKQAKAKEPTCTEVGWEAYEYCARCDYSTKVEIGAKGHTETAWKYDVQPTCTGGGHRHKECTVCHVTTVEEDIQPNGHHFKTDWQSDATNHWHEADCGHNVIIDLAKHTLDENFQCTVCKYQDTALHGTEINTDLLEKNGTDLHAIFSNSVEVFSFLNDIEVANEADFAVYTDISFSAESEVRSKTINLIEGDNTVYILVSNGKEKQIYTTTIRRRPIYVVRFFTRYGETPFVVQVEEGSVIEEPILSAKGYTFEGWDYDFANGVMQDLVLTAKWTENIYTIEYVIDGSASANNVTEYTVNDRLIELNDGIGDQLFCGWYLENTFETYIDRIDASRCESITLYGCFNGTLGLEINNGNVVGYNGNEMDVVIPDKYKGETVTAIKRGAFDNGHISNLTIPDSITNIESDVSKSVENYNVYDNSRYLGNSANPYLALIYYNGTDDFRVHNDTKVIADDAFINSIPNGVTRIGAYAFANNMAITSITIPEGVTSIGAYAFSGCSNLTSVKIPNSITSIGLGAFSGCDNLFESDDLKYLGNDTNSCVAVIKGKEEYNEYDRIWIPDGTRVIADFAFSSRIKSMLSVDIHIPDSVVAIGEHAFYSCSGIDAVYITDIAKWCSITFEDQFSNPLCYARYLFINNRTISDLQIPDTVKEIKDWAFYNAAGLVINNLTLPDGLISIGKGAFSGSIKGYVDIVVSIPDSVTSIGDGAFSRCDITGVNIPNSISSIAYATFARCSNLREIVVPNSVTIIGESAFARCSRLEKLTIPFSVRLDYIFKNDTEDEPTIPANLKEVIITGGTYIADYAFRGCNGLTKITIPESVTSIGNSAFGACSALTQITIPNGVTSIGNNAFNGCNSLTSIKIPNGVTSIGRGAFSGCSGLKSVIIPKGVTSIGNGAFNGCSSLISITIPNGVTSIGQNAFYGCSSLSNITIPDSVTSIGYSAFAYCSSLKNITIGNGVISIGGEAFRDCGLVSVNIGTGVTSIGVGAFYNCLYFEKIYYSGTRKQWNRIVIPDKNDYNVVCSDDPK